MSRIKLIFQGIEQSNAFFHSDNESHLELENSYIINDTIRGSNESQEVEIDDNHIIEFVYDDQTTWVCDAETLSELFPELADKNRSENTALAIPLSLVDESNADRNIFGKIALKILNIFIKKAVKIAVHELAKDFENKNLNNQSGLFKLGQNFQLKTITPFDVSKPYLLFIHGTGSSTSGSFDKIWGSEVWDFMQSNFPDRILAFQHETLSKSPLTNAVELVKALPDNINLYIITHSRGGLIGEILSLYANRSTTDGGFKKRHIEFLRKEDRKSDIENIEKLNEIFLSKKIHVQRFVRAACPASGTTLASKRLSNFLNVLTNLIGLSIGSASNPIFIALKNLLSSVVSSKDDTTVLPGIEAQRPDSPFIKILNDASNDVGITDELVVLSGNAKPKVNLRGLLIITSRIFFSNRNDLVVDTKSMYLGVKRLNNIRYYFEEDTDIDHFLYFKNSDTRTKLLAALQPDINNSEFSVFSQNQIPETDRNIVFNAFGLDGGELSSDAVSGNRPIIVLLPGIMGSVLKDGNNRVWIDYFDFIAGELTRLDITNANIKATAIIKTSYAKFHKEFSTTYDIVTFAFDWRKSLMESAKVFKDKIIELLKINQPIKIVAHSMGGVLVRDFIINHNAIWQKLNSSAGFRTIFLGTPFGGSFRIPAVLMGEDQIIRTISKIDLVNTKKELLGIFNQFAGIHNLLPLTTDSDNDFSQRSVWENMREALGDMSFPIPSDSDLQSFKNYRDSVLNSTETIDYSNMVYIAGKGDATPCGYQVKTFNSASDKPKKELVFLATTEGDLSVTWESGIPQKIKEKNAVFYVNVTHGNLANDKSLFEGIGELLITGVTDKFSKTPLQTRGEQKQFVMPKLENFDLSILGVETSILGLNDKSSNLNNQVELNVSVSQGDLIYAAYPIFVGHFQNDGILNAEKVIDKYMDGVLSKRKQLNLYPEAIGTSEVFDTEKYFGSVKFKGSVIIGLGRVGELTAASLTQTFEQGVANYLLKLILENKGNTSQKTGISTLLIGCGYGGLSIETSINSIIEGVRIANEKIKLMYKNLAITVDHIEFLERYEDKSLSCYLILEQIIKNNNSLLKINFSSKKIKKLLGSQKRIVLDTNEEWWNRINVKKEKRNNVSGLSFSISIGGAKEDERTLFTSTPILDEMIKMISKKNQWSVEVAKALFELMIPNEFKSILKRQTNIVWVLDINTAEYPWELLQADVDKNGIPLCVGAGMIRKLRTTNSILNNNIVTENKVLVIADPILANNRFNQLPGAKIEGEKIVALFNENNYSTVSKIQVTAFEIVKILFSGSYKMIHLAGHGFFDKNNIENSGMVIGNNLFLTTAHIAQLNPVPEFVFVNCCELGEINASAEIDSQNNYKLAANIGTQLIESGVKAVVVAGWAVDDIAALKFTEIFYTAMFDGDTFADAILKARKYIFNEYGHNNNTWGAYQCYGDQFYKFSNKPKKATEEFNYALSEQAENDFFNFLSDLEIGKNNDSFGIEKLNKIIRAVDNKGIRTPRISEYEAETYAELGIYPEAYKIYEKLIKVENASFSVKALEKYCNIRSKSIVCEYSTKTGKTGGESYLQQINKVIEDLNRIIAIHSTCERLNLLGSAYKRKGYIIDANTDTDKIKAYNKALNYYKEAASLNNEESHVYSLTNWISLSRILSDKPEDVKIEEFIRDAYNLVKKNSDHNTNYWSMAKEANLQLCEFIVLDKISKQDVFDKYTELWKYAGTKGKKLSEIEHLEIIHDLMKLKSHPKKDAIEELIKLLKDMIKN